MPDLPLPREATRPRALRPLVLLSAAHFFIDLYSGALGALQPLLVARHGLSLMEAGILGGLLSFSSSVMQPLYGYLSDRFGFRALTVLAPFVTGLFISSLGLASGYSGLIVLVLLGGIGIASFHPQGADYAASTWHARRGLAMSIFITSGTLGLSLGPTYFSTLTTWLGLERAWWAALPGLLITLILLAQLPPPPRRKRAGRAHFEFAAFRPIWKPMLQLYFLVVIRSVVQIVFTQFLPLYLNSARAFGLRKSSAMLTLFLFGGGIGGFVGGNLADRFGGKRVVTFSMIASVPFLLLFLGTTGPISAFGLFAGGLILLFTTPVNVTLAQELVPSQVSTVSALMMGFAWGVAGLIGIPFVGWIGDHVGLERALWGVVLLPLIGFVIALRLPAHARPRAV